MNKLNFILITIITSVITLSAQATVFRICEPRDSIYNTKTKFSQDGVWSRERSAVHKRIVDQVLAESGAKPDAHPQIIYTSGAPGAGKSTTLNQLHRDGVLLQNNYVRIDPDALKKRLPEYDLFKDVAPEKVDRLLHSEAKVLRELLLKTAFDGSYNIILEGTFAKKEEDITKVKNRKDRYPQYRVMIVHTDASEANLNARVENRRQETGRVVPQEAILWPKQASIDTVQLAIEGKVVDEVIFLNNDDPNKLRISITVVNSN